MLKDEITTKLTEAKTILRNVMNRLPSDDLKRHGDLCDMIDKIDQIMEDKCL